MEYRGFRYEIAKVVGDRTYATLRTKRVIDALCPAELRSGKIRRRLCEDSRSPGETRGRFKAFRNPHPLAAVDLRLLGAH